MTKKGYACALASVLLACASFPASANGSLFCEGRPYSAEVQFSLSSGRLTDLIVSRDDGVAPTSSRRFALQRRSVDYRRQSMRAGAGKGVALRVAKARGTLTYAGGQHVLRCDWSSIG